MPKFSMWSLCFRFLTKILYAPLLSPTHATGTLFDVYLTSDSFGLISILKDHCAIVGTEIFL